MRLPWFLKTTFALGSVRGPCSRRHVPSRGLRGWWSIPIPFSLDLLGLVHTPLPVATLPVLNPDAAYLRDFSHRRGGRQSCWYETFLFLEYCSYEWSDEPLVFVFAEVDVVFPMCGRASLDST